VKRGVLLGVARASIRHKHRAQHWLQTHVPWLFWDGASGTVGERLCLAAPGSAFVRQRNTGRGRAQRQKAIGRGHANLTAAVESIHGQRDETPNGRFQAVFRSTCHLPPTPSTHNPAGLQPSASLARSFLAASVAASTVGLARQRPVPAFAAQGRRAGLGGLARLART
jgi:hypothetical protein